MDVKADRLVKTYVKKRDKRRGLTAEVEKQDAEVAATMEAQFLDDIARSIAITLNEDGRLMAAPQPRPQGRARRSARRVAREVTGVARSLGAAVTGSRPVEDFEAGPLLVLGATFCAMAALFVSEPRVIAWPAILIALWAGITLLVDGWKALARRRAE